jgi:polyisoprenyl-phosphate glycosyltransferase
MLVSVVIPVYNGSKTIGRLVEEINRHLGTPEIILVNDGSRDNSESVCEELARQHGNVSFISLRRNFGEHNAVMCGLNYATGNYIAIVDDDFQNPPSEIIKLVEEAEKGYDVVYSKYKFKKHSLFRNLGSRFNDYVATWLLNKPKNLYLSSFKVIHREVVKEIIKYKGPFPYVDGLILRVTGNFSTVLVEHSSREEGKSNYTLGKLISLYLNMFLNFSIKPLRIFTFLGVVSFIVGILLSVAFVIEKLLNPETAIGWTSTIVATLIFSGIQLMFLGLVGEYLGKSYLDQNKTPQWVVKKEVIK